MVLVTGAEEEGHRPSDHPHPCAPVRTPTRRSRASRTPALRLMERLKERRSLAHIADKFNTAPPPGYVAGRGRGISGFSKPLVPPKGRGGGGGASSCEAQGGGSSSAALVSGGNMGEAYEADATDTRELDLSETTRFEKDDLSMDSAEAGGKMEPFNMSAERKEGQFDDDFNYVWNRKGDDPDDVRTHGLERLMRGPRVQRK